MTVPPTIYLRLARATPFHGASFLRCPSPAQRRGGAHPRNEAGTTRKGTAEGIAGASRDLARGELSPGAEVLRNVRFCDTHYSPAVRATSGVQNSCPKSTSHNHRCQTVVRRSA